MSSPVITFKMKSVSLSKTLSNTTAHSDILLLLLTHQPEYEFGGSLTDVQIVFQSALN